MEKRQWVIVVLVVLASCACIYMFNPWRVHTLPVPQKPEEVVKPEPKPAEPAKPEEPKKPEPKPTEPVKVKAPDTVVFESAKGKVTFNHAAHAEAYACNDCHHKTKDGETSQKCKTCHEKTFSAFHNKTSNLSCVGCHKAVGAGPGYTPCSGCHKK